MRTPSELSQEELDGAVQRLEQGDRLTHISDDLGVNYTSLTRFLQRHYGDAMPKTVRGNAAVGTSLERNLRDYLAGIGLQTLVTRRTYSTVRKAAAEDGISSTAMHNRIKKLESHPTLLAQIAQDPSTPQAAKTAAQAILNHLEKHQ